VTEGFNDRMSTNESEIADWLQSADDDEEKDQEDESPPDEPK